MSKLNLNSILTLSFSKIVSIINFKITLWWLWCIISSGALFIFSLLLNEKQKLIVLFIARRLAWYVKMAFVFFELLRNFQSPRAIGRKIVILLYLLFLVIIIIISIIIFSVEIVGYVLFSIVESLNLGFINGNLTRKSTLVHTVK